MSIDTKIPTLAKILFVCHGNVGRSQIAEAYYNHFTSKANASSAGTDPTTPARYPAIDASVCKVMMEEGIDISDQFVKTINKEMINSADRIYVMCDKKLCPDFLLESSKVIFWKIDDPFNKGLEGLRQIRDQIKIKVKSILV